MTTFYFDVRHAIQTHDEIIRISGGLAGERDIGQLDSVLTHICNDMYYPTFEEKLTHLIYCVNMGHAWNDGNKRSSIALGAYFLEINGYDYCVKMFIEEMENISVFVAEKKINKNLLQKIVASLLYEPEYSESLKIEILTAITP